MAEQLANLQTTSTEIKSISIPVTNVNVSTTWGSMFYTSTAYDLGVDVTNKKVFVSFIPSTPGGLAAWTYVGKQSDATKISVGFCRATAGTLDGTLNVLIV